MNRCERKIRAYLDKLPIGAHFTASDISHQENLKGTNTVSQMLRDQPDVRSVGKINGPARTSTGMWEKIPVEAK
jgi:hypothetical protein